MPTVPLPIIPPTPAPAAPRARWRRVGSWLPRLYRFGIVVAIVWLLHRHHARLQIDGDAPITLDEVRATFPGAASLEVDASERQGLFVLDKGGTRLGYVLRTSPAANHIVGYAGPTDTLVAMDGDMRVIGIRVRSSADTRVHVKDVVADEYFMKTWNGKTWDQVAGLDPKVAGIEGVSGASLTSMGIANAIRHRFHASTQAAAAPPPAVRFRWHDAGLVAILVVACAFTFTHLRSRTWLRRTFQVVLIGYLGFWNGQLLAQSLMAGWGSAGVPWRIAPGLALLLAASLVVPWTSRRALYCSQICPHGAAQEILGRLTRRKWHVPPALDRGLRRLPPALVFLALVVTIVGLPVDLADVEPFDAYLLRGGFTVAIAIFSLLLAIFVPMGYCKYGCPTGAVLSFVRSHGSAEKFGQRDVVAGILLLAVTSIYLKYDAIHIFVVG
jgi:hypothetical protein